MLKYRILNLTCGTCSGGNSVRVLVYDPSEYWVTERTVDAQDFPAVPRALQWVSTTYPGIEEDTNT